MQQLNNTTTKRCVYSVLRDFKDVQTANDNDHVLPINVKERSIEYQVRTLRVFVQHLLV
jgi:hypothetical protein